ncbi:CotO family spore coat protein [Cytobacillus dafuensis]|nr:CotO family spore coat protein [Cytobacillus dafuensis]
MLKKKQKAPLFYIQQPVIQLPVGNMQEIYSSKRAENKLTMPAAYSIEENTNLPSSKEESFSSEIEVSELKKAEMVIKDSEMVQEVIDSIEEKNINSSSFESKPKMKLTPSFKRLKSFKEMNNLERIDYLKEFPKQMPPVPCIFETEENSWRGIFVGKNDETIEIKLLDGKSKSIEIQALKEIRMVGFRR